MDGCKAPYDMKGMVSRGRRPINLLVPSRSNTLATDRLTHGVKFLLSSRFIFLPEFSYEEAYPAGRGTWVSRDSGYSILLFLFQYSIGVSDFVTTGTRY